MNELLRPPDHRGPLIAAGAVTLAVGIAAGIERLSPAAGWVLAVAGALAAVCLWLGLQGARPGPPPAFASVLVVTGLIALAYALLGLAEVLGAQELGSGTVAWVALALAAVAAWAARRRSSAIATLIAVLAGGVSLLAAYDWIFDPEGVAGFRWLLLALAVVYALASLPLRGTSLRHAEQMVNASGTAILTIGLFEGTGLIFGSFDLPAPWRLVVLVGGLGLVAYAAADRAPGPAYLGAANLVLFILATGADGDDLRWWPLVLLVVGGGMLLAGLRPRRPLPPEPESSTRPDDLPLTVRVRRD